MLQELRRIFRRYAESYDSDLFSPHRVDVQHFDEPILAEILAGLYGVPGGMADYDFSLIDADILGAVYEQYLGYVAQESKRRDQEIQRRMELGIPGEITYEITEKAQRRKEQGIYYTPLWVVDYIVRQTVGRFIEEHQKRPDAIHELKILDMACGSGSFLIRAYDELLKWQAQQAGMPIERLTQEYRTPLLLNNIYGVDLDPQAVEIARLNLLLRALAHRELLPSLADNVRRGNSLIYGTEEELRPYFGDAWADKRRFNWEEEFPAVMERGGFDVVIGNPPYVRIQSLDRREADYYRANHSTAFGSFDVSILFLERGIELLRPGGFLGFITSGRFLKAEYGKRLQGLLRAKVSVERIVDLSAHQVFAEATNYPVIILLRKEVRERALRYTALPTAILDATAVSPVEVGRLGYVETDQDALGKGVWPPPVGEDATLVRKLASCSDLLKVLTTNIFQGLITSADRVYHLQKTDQPSPEVYRVHSRTLDRAVEIEGTLLKPLLTGKEVHRYYLSDQPWLLLFPYFVKEGKVSLIPESDFRSRFPKAWEYLTLNRRGLEEREKGKMRNDRWYAFGRTQSMGLHDYPKLAIPHLVYRLECFYDNGGQYYLDNVDVGGVLLKDGSHRNYLYTMGLLNSRLLNWYFQKISIPFRGGYRSANRQFLEPLPIRRIDFSDATDKEMHGALVALVERMLALQERLKPLWGSGLSEEHDLLREVERVDADIDKLVYDLYGLTEAERRLVEGGIAEP